MPLSEDTKTVETSEKLVSTLKGLFHTPDGFRPAHAKGEVLAGTFTPTLEAARLSVAPHLNKPSTDILVRFSSSTGLADIPDTDSNGNPRGMAIRFVLGERKHTDIISHSTAFFPMRTGEGTLELFQSIGNGTAQAFVAANPTAAAFLSAPKPTPASFAREKYFSVNAFKLVDKEGNGTFIRYRLVPEAGTEYLSDDEVNGKSSNFLFEDIEHRIKTGESVIFKLMAQVAKDGDTTDDATVHWPEDRALVELGTIKVEGLVGDSYAEQKRIIFDPIPRVEGIEPSADPLLEVRADVYLISGKQRRQA